MKKSQFDQIGWLCVWENDAIFKLSHIEVQVYYSFDENQLTIDVSTFHSTKEIASNGLEIKMNILQLCAQKNTQTNIKCHFANK